MIYQGRICRPVKREGQPGQGSPVLDRANLGAAATCSQRGAYREGPDQEERGQVLELLAKDVSDVLSSSADRSKHQLSQRVGKLGAIRITSCMENMPGMHNMGHIVNLGWKPIQLCLLA